MFLWQSSMAVYILLLDIYFGGVAGLYTCCLPCPKQAHYTLRQILIQHIKKKDRNSCFNTVTNQQTLKCYCHLLKNC